MVSNHANHRYVRKDGTSILTEQTNLELAIGDRRSRFKRIKPREPSIPRLPLLAEK